MNEFPAAWVEAPNGYVEHTDTYLSRPTRHSTGLLDWHDDEPNLRPDDNQRAPLSTRYFAQRAEGEELRHQVRAESRNEALRGIDGYRLR